MSGAVKAIIGVVLIVVGAVITAETWGTGGQLGLWIARAGVALLYAGAIALFIKAPRLPPLAGVSINYSGTLEPRRILYGQLKVGGVNAIPPL